MRSTPQKSWLRAVRTVAQAGIVVALLTLVPRGTRGNDELPGVPQFSAEEIEYFEKEVRPILVARCYECHSNRVPEPKGGLRVDSRAALIRGGDTGPAVVPGDLDKGLLVDAINYGDLYQMPPKSRLPAAEVEILTKWVARGVPWPRELAEVSASGGSFDLAARQASHWCWSPVQVRPPPEVKTRDWVKHDLDRFILARLEERGLSPAGPADKRALIRRAYFDLVGLPPSPEEVERFVRDESPGAFQRVVDELLESPHFGERWARHWMDVVRYAETCGHEFDYPIHHAWRYRDYLIRAFNADLPYDQFVVEHLAGDLLAKPRLHPVDATNESIVGTGFWFLYEATHAPVDVRADQAGRVDNQIDVFSKAFLGLTVACARCHDHKFDAISTKDYYSLAGFLHSSRRQEAMLDPDGTIHAAAMRIAAACGEVDTSLAELAGSAEELAAESFARYLLAAHDVVARAPDAGEREIGLGARRSLAEAAAHFDLPPKQLTAWVAAMANSELARPEHPLHLWRQIADKPAAPGTVDFAGWRDQAQRDLDRQTSEAAEYQRFASFASGSYDGWFVAGESFANAPTRSGEWDPLAAGVQLAPPDVAHGGRLAPQLHGVLRSPTFTINHRNIFYRLAGNDCEVRLIIDGYTMVEFHDLLFKGVKFNIGSKEPGFTWHRQAGDLGMYLGHRAYIEVIDHGGGWAAIDEIWFSDRDRPPSEASSSMAAVLNGPPLESLAQLAQRHGLKWQEAVGRWRDKALTADDTKLINWVIRHGLLDSGEAMEAALSAGDSARRRIASWTDQLPAPERVLAILDGTGENERVSIRGNPRTPGDEAPRQLLTALASQPAIGPVGKYVGEPVGSGRLELAMQIADPANPLTARVMVNRLWQHMFGRGIVASVDNFGVLGERPTHPELLDFLAHQFVQDGWSVKRLLRSLVLSATYQMSSVGDPRGHELDPANDLLHAARIRRLQGEAIRDAMLTISGRLDRTLGGPSVAVHITPFMQGRGKPRDSGPLDGSGRRSIYIEVRRNFLPPMMLAFDMPIPFNAVGRRNASNVPAQALILMNDPFVIEQARRWAEVLLADSDRAAADRVRAAYAAALARSPSDVELAQALDFIAIQGHARGLPSEHALLDAGLWSDFCHVLFNVKEFAFVP